MAETRSAWLPPVPGWPPVSGRRQPARSFWGQLARTESLSTRTRSSRVDLVARSAAVHCSANTSPVLPSVVRVCIPVGTAHHGDGRCGLVSMNR